jgi:LPS-assembly lipoprotein
MSLLEERRHRRAYAALLMGLSFSGCSIQPLYGSLPSGGNVADELQTVAVDPIGGRLGHYLGDELIFGFNGTGSHVPAKYHLTVTVSETAQTPLLDTVTGYPTAANVVVNADYKLVPTGGGEPVAKGRVVALSSYDRSSERFANLRAARDAEIRDAKTLADQLRTRLAADLAARS